MEHEYAGRSAKAEVVFTQTLVDVIPTLVGADAAWWEARIRQMRGAARVQIEKFEEAECDLLQSLQIYPIFARAARWLGECYIGWGKVQLAAAVAKCGKTMIESGSFRDGASDARIHEQLSEIVARSNSVMSSRSSTVALKGLKSSSQLNGKQADVILFQPEKGRFRLRLLDGSHSQENTRQIVAQPKCIECALNYEGATGGSSGHVTADVEARQLRAAMAMSLESTTACTERRPKQEAAAPSSAAGDVPSSAAELATKAAVERAWSETTEREAVAKEQASTALQQQAIGDVKFVGYTSGPNVSMISDTFVLSTQTHQSRPVYKTSFLTAQAAGSPSVLYMYYVSGRWWINDTIGQHAGAFQAPRDALLPMKIDVGSWQVADRGPGGTIIWTTCPNMKATKWGQEEKQQAESEGRRARTAAMARARAIGDIVLDARWSAGGRTEFRYDGTIHAHERGQQ
jgi:hypothetical protein